MTPFQHTTTGFAQLKYLELRTEHSQRRPTKRVQKVRIFLTAMQLKLEILHTDEEESTKRHPTPPTANPGPHNTTPNRRNVPVQDLWLHAWSFHKVAKALAASLQPDATPFTDFDLSPVVFMYRHALELHLKALVLGEGGKFLATKPDMLSIHKTHSVSWLAQFVCQIVAAVKWEKEFQCEGVENLAEFKAVVEELGAVDPGSYVFRLPVSGDGEDAVLDGGKPSIREFARRMDVLLELLDSTADALAATGDLQSDRAAIEAAWNSSSGFDPPIQ